jgi:type I restriction enzyme, S subunit
MAGELVSVRLGDVTDLLTGFPFKSERYVEDAAAPRLLRGDNVGQGVLRWDGAKRWPPDVVEDLASYWLREGDVILAMDRPWIEAGLKYASVRRSDLPSLLVQRVARLRGTHRLDTGFLKLLIGSQAFTDHVTAVQTGTAVPHISGSQIKSFEFQLPPSPTNAPSPTSSAPSTTRSS